MTEGQLQALLQRCPVLYHMAALGAWPGIRRHGLLSTSALLDLHGISGERRAAIERRRRPGSVTLHGEGPGTAVIRDQTPMTDAGLRRCLQDGMAPEEWYRLLNGKVFFWLRRERLLALLGARLNRGARHEVLELDAAALVAAYRDRITLSPINSGTTVRRAAPRGKGTFPPIAEYGAGGDRRPPVELAVDYAVPDAARFVRRVVVMPERG